MGKTKNSKLSSTSNSKERIKYPFRVDYNDHFETPHIAYEHILPLLDAVAPSSSSNPPPKKKKRPRYSKEKTTDLKSHDDKSDNRHQHVIYDPYYCNGKMKEIFHGFGFTNVQHEKRDFYKDIKQQSVPFFHTMVTNPPYSENHKEKCMQFAMKNLREGISAIVDNERGDKGEEEALNGKINDGDQIPTNNRKPFFILMPNYVACRNHFRSSIMTKKSISDPLDILYIVPSIPYEYEHPEGTGKDIPPFSSIWYCGIPLDKVDNVKEVFREAYGEDSVGVGDRYSQGTKGQSKMSSSPRLVSSLTELKQINAVPTQKRPNPKQRKKARMSKLKNKQVATSTANRDKEQNKSQENNGHKKRKRRY